MKPEPTAIRVRAPRLRLCVATDFATRTHDAGLDRADGFDRLMESGRAIAGGRGPNRALDTVHPTVRLRPSRRGGWLARVLGDRFLSSHRPFREFEVWTSLRSRGIDLPTPVLAVSRRRGLFWRSAFGSVDHGTARDGAAWIESDPSPDERRAACVAFARALRRLHDAGGLHGDLHLRNVLVEQREDEDTGRALRCVLIDLDRGRVLRRVSPRQRIGELIRFARSLEKAEHDEWLSARYRALVLSAYCAKDRDLRRAMQRWVPLETVGLVGHRLGWRLGARRLNGNRPS